MTAEITRLSGLTTSLIRSFAAGAPPENVSLALGEPGWPLPEPAREALRRWASDADLCTYGPNHGIDELRSAIVNRVSDPEDHVMVTAGSQAALYAVITAHIEPGRAVALPDPGFPAYRTLTHLAGGTALTYPLATDGSLDAPSLIDALDRHARAGEPPVRMLILNHPGNPTGGGATVPALAEVAQACAVRDIVVVSDEVYRELPYASTQPSLRDVTDEGIVTESVSKAWSAPGLRVGWAIGPPALLAPARLVHNAMTTAAARPSQLAAAALLGASASVLATSRAELAARWALVGQHAPPWLSNVPAPAGGFYLWAPVPDSASDAASGGGDPQRWVTALRDLGGVSVVPGSAFGTAGRTHVRISIGGPQDDLVEGLLRLSAFGRGVSLDG